MDNVGALLRLLGSRRKAAVPKRETPGWIVGIYCIFALLYAIGCVIAVSNLIRALHAGSWNSLPRNSFGWNDFTGDVGSAFLIALQLTLYMVRGRTDVSRRQLYAAARILRFVAAGNDESLAPQATWLLDGLRSEPVPAVPTQLEPLPPITGFGTGRAGHQLCVSADKQGLRWTPPGKHQMEQRLDWRDARAFFLVQYSDAETGAGRHVAFVLDAPDATLIWDERTSNKPQVLGVSDSLCALILARTGLPLRELTGIAVKITSPRWKPAYASLPEAFWQPLPGDDPTAPTLPAPETRWKLARTVFYATLPLFLILAELGVIGWSLPH